MKVARQDLVTEKLAAFKKSCFVRRLSNELLPYLDVLPFVERWAVPAAPELTATKCLEQRL